MKCCYTGPHRCSTCSKEYGCSGVDGINNSLRTYWYQGHRQVCSFRCLQYAPKPNICWSCFNYFPTSGSLFRHLAKNQDHQLDKPKFCPLCANQFIKVNICGEVYDFFNREEITDHLYLCVKRKNSWGFSGQADLMIRRYLDDQELKKYKTLVESLKMRWCFSKNNQFFDR